MAVPRRCRMRMPCISSLHLSGPSLPATTLVEMLVQLTGLACLSLASGIEPHAMPIAWLTALSALRGVRYEGDGEDPSAGNVPPGHLLARRLSDVVALSLRSCPFVDDAYLVQLCTCMPQLRSLDLSRNTNFAVGLSALQHLTNLEVLGLDAGRPEWLEHVTAPSSLRRCCLGSWRCYSRPEQQARARHLLGKQVDAVFYDQHTPWW
jgi:hypothetical protein